MIRLFVSVAVVSVLFLWAAHAQKPAGEGVVSSPSPPSSTTVKAEFRTEPRFVRAVVFHGKKKLGTTPFIHEFKRDSGPVDLVVKAPGYFTVNTRAYTFSDDLVIVKMTKKTEGSGLLGYKAPIVPDAGLPDAGTADGGVALPLPVSPSP